MSKAKTAHGADLEHPAVGGSYIRQPGGALKRVAFTDDQPAAAAAADDDDAPPPAGEETQPPVPAGETTEG